MITIQAGYALVLDDEPANRDFLERLLQTAGFKVSGAATGTDGLRIANAFPELALALVDQELPDATGLEIITKLRQKNPEALLVMATMHDDRVLIDEAFEKGADVFLVKPHGFMELYRRLQAVDNDTSLLRRVIIDQYGPRPYKVRTKSVPETKHEIPAVTLAEQAAQTPATSNTTPNTMRTNATEAKDTNQIPSSPQTSVQRDGSPPASPEWPKPNP